MVDEDWDQEDEPAAKDRAWIMPALAVAAILGWSGFYGFAHRAELAGGGTPSEWSNWIVAWSIPVLLILAIWLLAMRSSSREAARFGNIAHMLSAESSLLETRLITVNRELSLAREFIAAQSRDLESLGRVAAERLSDGADRLSGLIHQNTAQIDSIASVSTTALENMDRLRGELPVIANSARDVTSQIGNAGHTAQTQLEELIGGFNRLNTFGEASERQVQALRARIDNALGDFEKHAAGLADSEASTLFALSERLSALRSESEGFTATLRKGETEALQKWQRSIAVMRDTLVRALNEIAAIDSAGLDRSSERIEALGKEAQQVDAQMELRAVGFTQALETRRRQQAEREAEDTGALERRLAELDAAVAQRQQDQLAKLAALTDQGEALAMRLQDMGSQIEAIAARGGHVGGQLSQSIEVLSNRLNANRQTLAETETTVGELTEASIRLLELIQAGATHSRDQLPKAILEAQRSLDNFEEQARGANLVLAEASKQGEKLATYVVSAQQDGSTALEQIGTLHTRIAAQGEAHAKQIEALKLGLSNLGEESEGLSRRVQGEMVEAVERLQGALRATLAELEDGSDEAVRQMAERISEQSAEAIDRAIRLRTAEAIGGLEQSAAHASGVSKEAARQLRDNLAKVDELASNLENRVQRARERAEEQVDNDFARRVALITESLNSNAIDIAKALSNDVTDTAWASYLRGDRGIFTRRAVRLFDNSEAREVAEIYERDSDFREHVSRYIHDFEGMLRTMLSTRDGHALGVTVLSSDMGKLYVALAQAIDRLRD